MLFPKLLTQEQQYSLQHFTWHLRGISIAIHSSWGHRDLESSSDAEPDTLDADVERVELCSISGTTFEDMQDDTLNR